MGWGHEDATSSSLVPAGLEGGLLYILETLPPRDGRKLSVACLWVWTVAEAHLSVRGLSQGCRHGLLLLSPFVLLDTGTPGEHVNASVVEAPGCGLKGLGLKIHKSLWRTLP